MGIIEPQQRAQTVVMVQILNGVLKVFHCLLFMVFKVPYYAKFHVHTCILGERKFEFALMFIKHTFSDFYIYLI